jgi:hypothetical protein
MLDRDIIDRDPALAYASISMARAHWGGDIPADACPQHSVRKMGPLEAHCPYLSPSVFPPES